MRRDIGTILGMLHFVVNMDGQVRPPIERAKLLMSYDRGSTRHLDTTQMAGFIEGWEQAMSLAADHVRLFLTALETDGYEIKPKPDWQRPMPPVPNPKPADEAPF